jgi:hypothetical protein
MVGAVEPMATMGSAAVKRRAAGPSGAESRSAPLTWQYRDGVLLLLGDCASSWLRRARTWAYVGHARIELPGNHLLRTQLSLLARTSYHPMDTAP